MKNHEVSLIEGGSKFYCVCECGDKSESYPKRQEAQDWIIEHHRNVERALASANRRTPTLKSQRRWFDQKANDPTVSARDQKLWALLRDELDQRLNQHQDEDVPMFDMEE